MRLYHVTLGLCGFSALAGGCYSYAPVQTPQPGMEVRAQLETEAAVRRSAGQDEPITRYDGRIVDITSNELALDVLIARSTSTFQDVEIRDTIRLARTDVRAIQERRLSPVKTALVTLGAAAAAVGIVAGVEAISGGTGPDDGQGPPPTFRPFLDLSRFGLPVGISIGREE